jgi:hypothetical protein
VVLNQDRLFLNRFHAVFLKLCSAEILRKFLETLLGAFLASVAFASLGLPPPLGVRGGHPQNGDKNKQTPEKEVLNKEKKYKNFWLASCGLDA